ncbi:TerB family tellurite resistance protein [Chitinophaga pinensis]|uniref:TerB family tellurite resistance protein n=1 Tax=Chitinophaga pinensis TaxID=79329 RepID=A0A5C6LXH1_9BACT|nr:TerB family tellurite resistance protein [Chitinophaga pinensis]TWW01337.1 TerB family tellurite resistance protein [Chitinophaga pinensis]
MNLYHMALADEHVDIRELELLYRIGEDGGINRTEIETLIMQAEQPVFISPTTLSEKISYLYDLSLMACADGKIDEAEQKLLIRFCSLFGFKQENVLSICEYLLGEAARNTPIQQVLSNVSKNL